MTYIYVMKMFFKFPHDVYIRHKSVSKIPGWFTNVTTFKKNIEKDNQFFTQLI